MKPSDKSVYIFLTAILGLMLILSLQRILVFYIWLLLSEAGSLGTPQNSLTFLAADYLLMVLAGLGGVWYGIWLGEHWYKKVYEEKTSYGFLAFASASRSDQGNSLQEVKKNLQAAEEVLEGSLSRMPHLSAAMDKTEIFAEPVKSLRASRVAGAKLPSKKRKNK